MQQRSSGSRPNVFRFFNEVIGELRRVTWPTMPETFRLTLMVFSVAAYNGFILCVADILFGWFF